MLPIRAQALVLALLAGTSWLCPVAKGGGCGRQLIGILTRLSPNEASIEANRQTRTEKVVSGGIV